ncbi:gamma-glutamylcyclotransferase [Bacillus sp. AK128]
MTQSHFVFVYGTLRIGETNHYLLERSSLVAEQCWTFGEMFDSGFGYPAIRKSTTSLIYGELYSVNDEELKQLDELEDYIEGGTDNLYNRISQTIHTDTKTIQAFIYVANDIRLLQEPITHGDWKRYRLLNHEESILYFAYGSCMDDQRFIEHGVEHYFKKVKGRGVLAGYSLRFTKHSNDGGRADLVEEGGVVEGKVYEIPIEAIFNYLFDREGVNFQTYRPTFVTIETDGNILQNVLTFVVVQKKAELAPPLHYEKEIIRGANGLLSEEYV